MKRIIRGNELMLFVNGSSIAGAKSHSLSISGEVVEQKSKDNPLWVEKRLANISWTCRTNNLFVFDDAKDLYQAMHNGTLIDIQLSTPLVYNTNGLEDAALDAWTANTTNYFKGKAIIRNIEITADVNDYAIYSVDFDGSGILSMITSGEDNPDTPENPDTPDTPDTPDNPDNPDTPDTPVVQPTVQRLVIVNDLDLADIPEGGWVRVDILYSEPETGANAIYCDVIDSNGHVEDYVIIDLPEAVRTGGSYLTIDCYNTNSTVYGEYLVFTDTGGIIEQGKGALRETSSTHTPPAKLCYPDFENCNVIVVHLGKYFANDTNITAIAEYGQVPNFASRPEITIQLEDLVKGIKTVNLKTASETEYDYITLGNNLKYIKSIRAEYPEDMKQFRFGINWDDRRFIRRDAPYENPLYMDISNPYTTELRLTKVMIDYNATLGYHCFTNFVENSDYYKGILFNAIQIDTNKLYPVEEGAYNGVYQCMLRVVEVYEDGTWGPEKHLKIIVTRHDYGAENNPDIKNATLVLYDLEDNIERTWDQVNTYAYRDINDDIVRFYELPNFHVLEYSGVFDIQGNHFENENGGWVEPFFSLYEIPYETRSDNELDYINPEGVDYLHFTADEESTIGLVHANGYPYGLRYSYDKVNWEAWYADNDLTLSPEQTLYVKGYPQKSEQGICKFRMTGSIYAWGNIMSLVYGDSCIDKTALDYSLHEMFRDCTALKQAPLLPATNLYDPRWYKYNEQYSAYTRMFQNTGIVETPQLPATTISDHGYWHMFADCANLTTAHELPATIVDNYGYEYMFAGCAKLEEYPIIKATEIYEGAFKGMFHGCKNAKRIELLPQFVAPSAYREMLAYNTSLEYIKIHATQLGDYYSLYWWLLGASTSGTICIVDGTRNMYHTGDSGIPNGWTVETFIPE